jgi:phage shock protein C
MVFGVCQGVADYLDVSAFWLRAGTVVLFLMSWGTVLLVYILMALVMKPEPVVPFNEDLDREFYDSYVNSRRLALQRLKRTFDNLDRRIRRMETIVTARDYDWDRRFHESQ